jgi:hypothetical protein
MSGPVVEEVLSQSPDINLFVLAEGRLPRIGDRIAPWHYRGWLLYYVQLADSHPALPGRWTHHLRTLEAGKLLGGPIPQIKFDACVPRDGFKMLERCLDLIYQREYTWTSFNQFVDWLAWGLALSRERSPLAEETQEALYRSFNLEPLLLHPHDYLGEILAARRKGGWNPNAFFPTPHSVVELMVQMMLGRDEESGAEQDARLKTVLDPAVGTGRMLLHASNYSYCIYGCDIDPLVAMYVTWNMSRQTIG